MEGDAELGAFCRAEWPRLVGSLSLEVRSRDIDHAEVQDTLLHDGQPEFGLRTGTAVRIDGRWMVSRATERALLALGGIVCPPAA